MKELKTPYFIIYKEKLKKNIDDFNNALSDTWGNYIIGYSYKTNSLPWVLNFMKENGCFAEVVSDDEYNLAVALGNNEKRIRFNGPNKGREIFHRAIMNKGIINIDSWREINWLREEARSTDVINIGIRVNFNLEECCPNESAMGSEVGRFGFSFENGELSKAISDIEDISRVKIVGIHLHCSTKTRSLKVYEEIAKKACVIAKLINNPLDYVDIGGGFFGGMPEKPSYYEYMKVITDELSKHFNRNTTKLIVEPGASLIASPISFVCEVVDVKNVLDKRIVNINGSRSNIDPLMRKKFYEYELITNMDKIDDEQIICGYTCMENDRIMKLTNEKELTIGDKIIFNKVGSYTLCLSPLFIEYFPAVYVRENNKYKCVRERWGVNEYINKCFI